MDDEIGKILATPNLTLLKAKYLARAGAQGIILPDHGKTGPLVLADEFIREMQDAANYNHIVSGFKWNDADHIIWMYEVQWPRNIRISTTFRTFTKIEQDYIRESLNIWLANKKAEQKPSDW